MPELARPQTERSKTPRTGLWVGLICMTCCVPLSETAPAKAQDTPSPAQERSQALTLDRLYSLPRLIGTAPKGFSWSSDGEALAFLWNEEGTNFYDVWTWDARAPESPPVRASRMPRPEPAATPRSNDPLAEAERLTRTERHPGVTEVAWYPDDRDHRLLLTFAGDLWLLAPGADPRRLTEGSGPTRAASFSPDGRYLAFLRQGEVWLMTGAGEDERQLTRIGEPDVSVRSFRWSPRSDRLALEIADRRDVPVRSFPDYLTQEPTLVRVRRAYTGDPPIRQRHAIVTLDGALRPIDLGTPAPETVHSYRWSPDGARLAFDTSDLYVKLRRVLVMETNDSGDGRPDTVVREANPLNVSASWQIEWSPDGEGLYFLSDRDEDYHLYLAPLDGDEARRVTRGPWAVARFHVLPDGLLLVANRGRPEERRLLRVDLDGSGLTQVSERAGTHTPTVSPDGRFAAVEFSSDEMPPELLVTSLQGGPVSARERRITHSPLEEFDDYSWVRPRYVEFPSGVDGVTLHGRLTLPPDFDPTKSYPAILGSVYSDTVRNQWGGRTAHPTWGLDQYLAQEGYVLLNVDIRGSWGRGREFRQGIRLDYGGIDIEDLASGVSYLGTLGFVDPERVGIWGSSYGGLLTCMSLFRKPGLYAAGFAGAPATNVWHALTGQMTVMMRPEDQPDEYADSSAFLHADGLEDPLMILHGMRDVVVLFKDSVVLVDRLIQLGKDVDFVVLPDAGHGWDLESLVQTRFAFDKLVTHFNRHLKTEMPVNGREPHLRSILRTVLVTTILASLGTAATRSQDDAATNRGWTELEEIDRAAQDLAAWKRVSGVPDLSESAVEIRAESLARLQGRLGAIDPTAWTVSGKVDYLLVWARLNALEFEHRVTRPWSRDPIFYLNQFRRTPYAQPPLDEETRQRLAAVAPLVKQAQRNLDEASGELAGLAIFHLENFDGVGQGEPYRDDPPQGTIGWFEELCQQLATGPKTDLDSCRAALDAARSFRDWLREQRPSLSPSAGIGRDQLNWYLRHVRLLPYDVDDLVLLGRREFERYRAAYEIVRNRNRDLPQLELTRSREQHERRTREAERQIRELIAEQGLLTIPGDTPTEFETDTFWSPRATEDRHFWEELQFRNALNNHIHASVPGHRFDGLISRRVEDPIRRRYSDSSRAEGWATYIEEMFLLAGLTDEIPRAEELFYIALMKRASRIYAETQMHAGEFSLDEANRYLIDYVPFMEPDLGRYDLEGYLRRPGSGSGYIIGKIQLEGLLAERALELGDAFELGAFHDDLLSRGMIPLTLIRWEMTSNDDQVRELWTEITGREP